MFASLQGWKRVLRITLYIKILIILGLWTEWITETAVKGNARLTFAIHTSGGDTTRTARG